MDSSDTDSIRERRPTLMVVGSPEFHAAFPAGNALAQGREILFLDMDDIEDEVGADGISMMLVEAANIDQKSAERIFACARDGTEIRLLTTQSLRSMGGSDGQSGKLSDQDVVTGMEVGSRVNEKIRSSLGSIRLGSEILVSKARNSNDALSGDVNSLNREIVEFCESIGFYLDLRVPGGQAAGGWTRFDAFEELSSVLSYASARAGCKIHLSGQPGMVVSGFKRDPSRVVYETVQNSILHGFAKNIWLSVASDSDSGEVVLTVEDDGQGFLYREIVDGNFCLRIGESHLRSKGIGILICRRIVSRYRGRIDYSVKRDGGIRVEIRVQPHLSRPDTSSILAPIGLRIEE